jgi:hypothetical protein
MGATLNVRSLYGENDVVKGLLTEGIKEQKRKTEYALQITNEKIRNFEEKFGMSTPAFLKRFKEGYIKESDETFEWWAETKLARELEEKLEIIKSMEVCQ